MIKNNNSAVFRYAIFGHVYFANCPQNCYQNGNQYANHTSVPFPIPMYLSYHKMNQKKKRFPSILLLQILLNFSVYRYCNRCYQQRNMPITVVKQRPQSVVQMDPSSEPKPNIHKVNHHFPSQCRKDNRVCSSSKHLFYVTDRLTSNTRIRNNRNNWSLIAIKEIVPCFNSPAGYASLCK